MPKQSVKTKKKRKKSQDTKSDLAFFLSILATAAILLLSGFNLRNYFNKNKKEVLGIRKPSLLEERLFWETMVSQNPSYVDGWLELTRVTYELGDKDYAIGALNSAKSIDPNSKKIEDFEKESSLFGP